MACYGKEIRTAQRNFRRVKNSVEGECISGIDRTPIAAGTRDAAAAAAAAERFALGNVPFKSSRSSAYAFRIRAAAKSLLCEAGTASSRNTCVDVCLACVACQSLDESPTGFFVLPPSPPSPPLPSSFLSLSPTALQESALIPLHPARFRVPCMYPCARDVSFARSFAAALLPLLLYYAAATRFPAKRGT